MAKHTHNERHFLASETVRDVVIGMSDGLTVPFALAAGLTGAAAGSGIIVTAGLAEIAAGAVAMGLGGYLAARTDAEHYRSEYRRELRETEEMPDEERREVRLILTNQGLDAATADTVVEALTRDRHRWVDFMMRFELGLEKPDSSRAPASALTIGASYIVGGVIPLVSYMLIAEPARALYASIVLTLVALAAFGGVKGSLTGGRPVRAAVQTVVIGGIAAAVAFAIARLVSG
ncbi:MAG TPA: VIT1/CCC1 transporter family protein [Alphaproteobacteria bacterium]|nr:VIT1/CCC1 transporter family protein [Alphaproteobacteria bacterium]